MNLGREGRICVGGWGGCRGGFVLGLVAVDVFPSVRVGHRLGVCVVCVGLNGFRVGEARWGRQCLGELRWGAFVRIVLFEYTGNVSSATVAIGATTVENAPLVFLCEMP